jgi:hypothetical protein
MIEVRELVRGCLKKNIFTLNKDEQEEKKSRTR